MLIRPRQVSLTLLIFSVSAFILFHIRNPTVLPALTPSFSLGNNRHGVVTSLGKWRPSPERAKDTDLWMAHCYADLSPEKGGPDGRDPQAEHLVRTKQVAAWEWIPEDESPLWSFDKDTVIERSLKSRGGIQITGDSISSQMGWMMENFLGVHQGPWPRQLKRIVHVEENPIFESYSEFVLDPKHASFQELINKPSLASVPRWRFDLPIMTFYRSDVLINPEELDDIFSAVNMSEPVNRNSHRAKGDWRQGLYNASTLNPSWEGEMDTIVIISTGPHWSPMHMHPATDEELVAAYHHMMKQVHGFFTKPLPGFSSNDPNLSAPLPIQVFFRSTAPGHEDCGTFSSPVDPDSITALNPSPKSNPFGWHLFPTYNQIAREIWTTPDPAKSWNEWLQVPSQVRNGPSRRHYWDIWPMTVQRPDSHIGWTGKQYDCLHWCHPSVPQWWIKTLWHTIMTENL